MLKLRRQLKRLTWRFAPEGELHVHILNIDIHNHSRITTKHPDLWREKFINIFQPGVTRIVEELFDQCESAWGKYATEQGGGNIFFYPTHHYLKYPGFAASQRVYQLWLSRCLDLVSMGAGLRLLLFRDHVLYSGKDPEPGLLQGDLMHLYLKHSRKIIGGDLNCLVIPWSDLGRVVPAEYRCQAPSKESSFTNPDGKKHRLTLAKIDLGGPPEQDLRKVPRYNSERSLNPQESPLENREHTLVFISYSHKDRQWLERLQTMLKPLIRQNLISLFCDTAIKPGQRWRFEIDCALKRAKVAVLLVSPSFLASDFIAEEELPPLLNAARESGTKIIWVPLATSMYEETTISEYQAAHNPDQPLNSLSEPEVDRALKKICIAIKDASR